jgi:hypothetical protein
MLLLLMVWQTIQFTVVGCEAASQIMNFIGERDWSYVNVTNSVQCSDIYCTSGQVYLLIHDNDVHFTYYSPSWR